MILCCGEGLIDLLPVTLPGGETAYQPHAGGAVFNTALALGRLGARAGFLSGLSQDGFGALLRGKLAEASVAVLAAPMPQPTPLAVVQLTGGQASYSFYLDGTAGQQFHQTALPPSHGATAFFFGGISLVDEPCGTSYESLMQAAAPEHLVMIDPNIRPGSIKDDAAIRARYARLIGMADIVKLSSEDLAWLAPEDPQALIADLLAGPVRLLCLTKGAEGVEIHRPHQRPLSRPALPVQVADTVGAGDAFNAGLLAALQSSGWLEKSRIGQISNEDLRQAVDHALAVARVTVSRIGADPPWAHEI